MYKNNHPKVVLSEIIYYDKKTNTYYTSGYDLEFDTHKDLIEFLARANRPVLNWYEDPIPDRFKNIYLDNQALNGISEDLDYKYLFWLDTPKQPNVDVRLFKDEVDSEYKKILKRGDNFYNEYRSERAKELQDHLKRKQNRRRHKCYPLRRDARYIQRAKNYSAMKYEEGCKQFAKPKDKWFKIIWPDEDFCSGHSTGWKDNAGNRYRHQWEPKAVRIFRKAKKHCNC